MLGGFWQLNFGEVYRILDRLVDEKLIEQINSGARAKKVYRITDKGRESLDGFLLEVPGDAPRPLRHELAIKLLFSTPERLPQLLESVRHQRSVYLRALQRSGREVLSHSTLDDAASGPPRRALRLKRRFRNPRAPHATSPGRGGISRSAVRRR